MNRSPQYMKRQEKVDIIRKRIGCLENCGRCKPYSYLRVRCHAFNYADQEFQKEVMREKAKSAERKLWNIRIKERDNFTCQACGQRGDSRSLHAHHFRPGDKMENGITLCARCHSTLHAKIQKERVEAELRINAIESSFGIKKEKWAFSPEIKDSMEKEDSELSQWLPSPLPSRHKRNYDRAPEETGKTEDI